MMNLAELLATSPQQVGEAAGPWVRPLESWIPCFLVRKADSHMPPQEGCEGRCYDSCGNTLQSINHGEHEGTRPACSGPSGPTWEIHSEKGP